MKTLIVNAFGGPGCGKTTLCWHIASELKKRGILTEYVCEYAKELVYEERFDILNDSMQNQKIILKEQSHRLDRLIGKVEVVVTDSPLLLSIIYANDKDQQFINIILDKFNQYNNINLVVKRNLNEKYQSIGRKQSFKESKIKDLEIYKLLDDNNINYIEYERDSDDIINIIINEIKNLNQK